jgi:hypothetical protein
MSSEPAESELEPSDPSKKNEEHWSLVSVAFGAVSGTIISILVQPLIELLPGKLFEEFLRSAVESVLFIGLPILLAFAAARIRRLDHFLRKYLAPAALCTSLLLAYSLWTHAGRPVRLLPMVAAALTTFETWFFILFCGGAVQVGLSQIRGKQEIEYEKQREDDARRIAEEAIAEGDPAIATGIFGLNVAGAVGQAIGFGCLQILLLVFHMAAIWAVSTLDAYVFFRLSLLWSLAAGTIIAAAITRVVTFSQEFGERHSESIPLDEKYKGILPNREDRDIEP